jgi:hypothetical protein
VVGGGQVNDQVKLTQADAYGNSAMMAELAKAWIEMTVEIKPEQTPAEK